MHGRGASPTAQLYAVSPSGLKKEKEIDMNDLDVIRRIESKLEVSLRKISLGEIKKVEPWPTKAYALDDNGNVVGLQLDGYAISLDAELADLY